MDFNEIWYLNVFRKSIKKIQVSSKPDKNNSYFTWKPIRIFSYISLSSLEWEMFQTKFVEKMKTRILYSVTFSRKSCRLRNNVEKYGSVRQVTDVI
jgi:hypothetical protein